jgi:hypothetical protein
MGLSLPRIEATGRYEVTGNVLLFPVRSKGEFWAMFCKYHLHPTGIPNSSLTIKFKVKLTFSGRSSARELWVGVDNSVPPSPTNTNPIMRCELTGKGGTDSPNPGQSSPVGKQYKSNWALKV